MACITKQNNLGDLLKCEASNLYSRDQVTVARGQNQKLGTVIACHKDNVIKIINPTATDGTQTAISVIASDVNAKENTKAVIITRITMLADHAVVWRLTLLKNRKPQQ
jgi:UDP-N-acetylmuramyl tripeptide synthase